MQLLEDICQKNNWPPPVYTLHSTSSSNQHILVGEDVLFLYKVTLGAVGMTYMPSRLSRTVDEARCIAADYTLSNLGLLLDSELLAAVAWWACSSRCSCLRHLVVFCYCRYCCHWVHGAPACAVPRDASDLCPRPEPKQADAHCLGSCRRWRGGGLRTSLRG